MLNNKKTRDERKSQSAPHKATNGSAPIKGGTPAPITPRKVAP